MWFLNVFNKMPYRVNYYLENNSIYSSSHIILYSIICNEHNIFWSVRRKSTNKFLFRRKNSEMECKYYAPYVSLIVEPTFVIFSC